MALTVTLQAALASIEDDRTAAIQQLRAFRAQVEALAEQQLAEAEVQLLRVWSQAIIDGLASI